MLEFRGGNGFYLIRWGRDQKLTSNAFANTAAAPARDFELFTALHMNAQLFWRLYKQSKSSFLKQSKIHDNKIRVTLLIGMWNRTLTVYRKFELSVSERGQIPLIRIWRAELCRRRGNLKFKSVLLHFQGIVDADIKYKNRIHFSLSKNLYFFSLERTFVLFSSVEHNKITGQYGNIVN